MRKRPVVAILEKHYSRIRGELQAISAEVVQAGVAGPELAMRRATDVQGHRDLLAAIEQCLRLVEEGWTPEHIQPRRARKSRSPFPHGGLMTMAYDILREVPEPVTTSDLLEGLWLAGRITRAQSEDLELRAALTNLLRGQERVGAVRSHGCRPLRWSIIKAAGRLTV